jgi:hypothetical protein
LEQQLVFRPNETIVSLPGHLAPAAVDRV